MADIHKKMQVQLIEIYYGKKEIPKSVSKHLEDCRQCKTFWDDLQAVDKELEVLNVRAEPDFRVIHGALNLAGSIREGRRNMRDFLVFLVTGLLFLGTAGLLAYNGYGLLIIKLQLGLMITAPVFLPFFMRHRLSKEGN